MRYPPALVALFASVWLVWGSLAPLPAQDQIAVVGGTVHPVSGPAIDDGVVLIRGDRIVAVGSRDDVEIPPAATVISYPDGHVYPGLVDALTDAFADASVLNDRSSDAGTAILEGLDRHQSRSQLLVTYGITTAYVRNRGTVRWRGTGASLRPRSDGYEASDDQMPAAQMLLLGAGNHPLTRQKSLAAAGDALRAIEAYEKRFADHDKALEEYQTKYQEYLDYHRARGADAAEPPDAGARRGRGQRGRGQRGRGERGGRRRGGRRQGGDDAGGAGDDAGGEQGGGGEPGATEEQAAETEGEPPAAPTKPEYPEAPNVEPDKEVLRQVLAGERTLRIEARAADELRAALRLASQYGIARVVLEHASSAGPLAADLALQGIPVVLADLLPGTDAPDRAAGIAELPVQLAAADVSLAIASGSVRRARHLPLLAAYGVGQGIDPAVALRAITLTPAEILGLSRDIGSLEAGKLADVVVFSAPIFSSDARVLRVLSAGSTQYEAR